MSQNTGQKPWVYGDITAMNKFIPRKIQEKLNKIIAQKKVTVITGMRGVGKTTLLRHYFEKISSKNKLQLNLEDALTRKIFAEINYKNIVRALQQEGIDIMKKSYIFIDEIQFIRNMPSIIKYLYDEYDIKFVVSGSSSFYLKNHFSESLAGRKIIVDLYPLTFREFLDFKGIGKRYNKKFSDKIAIKSEISAEKYNDLYKEYINFGGFPEVALTDDKEIKNELLKDIMNSYFQIDVTTLADFKDIGKIRDILILLTQRIGQKINISNMANAFNIKRDKVYEYLEFLQSTYVIKMIPQKSDIDNKISADDKFYFTDTGIARLLAEVSEESKFENSVFMNLAYDYEITYYQTRSGGKIDFILDNSVGLEVKLNPGRQDLAILKKRADSAGISEYYLVGFQYSELNKTIMAWDL
jgi:predicted AAA+ superfamily ATPase